MSFSPSWWNSTLHPHSSQTSLTRASPNLPFSSSVRTASILPDLPDRLSPKWVGHQIYSSYHLSTTGLPWILI
ncbi:hypothetical protein HYC85_012648 [Camellia sinensis]|uniref:Uncharacterized protein n=1 Tax=Camellia sinensis TaxID=4442 RepID=A0A7J7HDF0_CAMSI|nr:hypothetical protein HYC85_012648 [Camellia sinensis]